MHSAIGAAGGCQRDELLVVRLALAFSMRVGKSRLRWRGRMQDRPLLLIRYSETPIPENRCSIIPMGATLSHTASLKCPCLDLRFRHPSHFWLLPDGAIVPRARNLVRLWLVQGAKSFLFQYRMLPKRQEPLVYVLGHRCFKLIQNLTDTVISKCGPVVMSVMTALGMNIK